MVHTHFLLPQEKLAKRSLENCLCCYGAWNECALVSRDGSEIDWLAAYICEIVSLISGGLAGFLINDGGCYGNVAPQLNIFGNSYLVCNDRYFWFVFFLCSNKHEWDGKHNGG